MTKRDLWIAAGLFSGILAGLFMVSMAISAVRLGSNAHYYALGAAISGTLFGLSLQAVRRTAA